MPRKTGTANKHNGIDTDQGKIGDLVKDNVGMSLVDKPSHVDVVAA